MRRLAALLLLPLTACRPHPRPHTVVMAWETFPLSLDPRLGNDQASERLLALTHQGLLRRDAALRLVPDGCLAWRWERPYTELAFDFPEPGKAPAGWFTFTSGAPLRAEDALWSVEALRDPAIRGARASVFQAEVARTWVAGATLHLALKAPDPGFPANLLRGGLGLVPAGAAGPGAPGSGPYRVLGSVPEESILLAARRGHPDFAGRPDPQDLELRRVPDASARLLALEHGSVQLAVANLPPDLAAAAKGVRVWTVPGASEEYVAFRCTDPPLSDARVRLALSLALDRDLLVRTLRNGWARPAWTFFPPEAPAGLAAAPPGTAAERRAEAERLLDAAGLRRGADGWRFRLTLLTTPELEARTKALALQDQWRRIGVDLRLATKEFGALYADVAAGRFQAVSLRWTGVTDPSILRRLFLSTARPPGDFNRGGFSDPEVDRLLREADADPDRRLADLREAQLRLAAAAPYAMLWWPDQIVAAASGVRVDLNGAGDFSAVWRDNRAP